MAATHTVLFTVMPRGISLNADTLPVSVLVSPRLVGADRLDAFPDWVDWTGRLTEGVVLTLRSGARHVRVNIDTAPLRPDLWRALFQPGTFVRSRVFDDYSAHGIVSYSVRESLSAVKAVYQEAGIVLALPDKDAGGLREQRETTRNRDRLATILEGLDVHWNAREAPRWRELVRRRSMSDSTERALAGPLDAEGLIDAVRHPGAFQSVAVPFAVFHHMPTPRPSEAGPVSIDPEAVDFHQALSSLESHPELLRALGLVFDLELPRDFVAFTAPTAFVTVAVESTTFPWQVPPASHALETACVHAQIGNARLFCTASRTQASTAAPAQVLGLLNLDPARYGVAQVDVDGAMHKVMSAAELLNRPDPGRSLHPVPPEDAPTPEVFDPDATLPSLRSGGLQLFVDRRGAATLDAIQQSKAFNEALESGGVQPRPFFAEDLVRGYRLDIWDSRTGAWHSLHRRSGQYRIGDDEIPLATEEEEGFFQLASTQPAPGAEPADKDLYVHEVIARWAGWSLSVPFPAKALSRYGDPDKAVPPDEDDPEFRTDEAVTPFKVRADYRVIRGSLPRLRFGSRYRLRARAVDLAGNSLRFDDAIASGLAGLMGLPRDPEGMVYLRYEPVAAPLVVIRDELALTSPGSAVHRLVIRTRNDAIEKDGAAADLTAGDRHIVPPRASVEMGERHGMFDGPDGKLKGDAGTWQLAADRDAGQFAQATIEVAGRSIDQCPIEPGDQIAALPHLPDPLARGAAIRNLPGSADAAVGRVAPDGSTAGAVHYRPLTDVNPRPGSATLIAFNTTADWEATTGFRLVLDEAPAGEADTPPTWDPASRVLTVFLAKGRTTVVPLSSYMSPRDLTLMGQWQWLREFVDAATVLGAQPARLLPTQAVDLVAHVLQRAVEGGHWMLTPPTLLTLVHAVQQPIGRPLFAPLSVDHQEVSWDKSPLQTDRARGRTDPQELAGITAWRRPGETRASLIGALAVHGASTDRVEIVAEWTDPVDALDQPTPGERHFSAPVDEIPLPRPREGYLRAKGAEYRQVGYYDPEHDQIAMVRTGDRAAASDLFFSEAAPRHELGDTRRHLVRYTAVATSRYREYFPQDLALDFTRTSDPVEVDVPASARPLAPDIVYVVPTFGWQRQTDTNMKRSVRFGGGLRVYLRRPWYSSGAGEHLGVALWSSRNGALTDAQRDKFKPFFTQWGMDPIWKTGGLTYAPTIDSFPDAVESDDGVSLEEASAALLPGVPGRVDVVGYAPQFDESRGLWFADVTVDPGPAHPTYSPFIRLALVRYQPHALDDARISRVVLAGFAQLTPDRTALVTRDPHHPRTLRVVVSGVAPTGPLPSGPAPEKPARPTQVHVRVQTRTALGGDLGWEDAPAADATVSRFYEGPGLNQPDLALWVGAVAFAAVPAPAAYRLLVEEFEHVSADYADGRRAPGRLIYAETFDIDEAFVAEA